MVKTITKSKIRRAIIQSLKTIGLILVGSFLPCLFPLGGGIMFSIIYFFIPIEETWLYIFLFSYFGLIIWINYLLLLPLRFIHPFIKFIIICIQITPSVFILLLTSTNQGSEVDTVVDQYPDFFLIYLLLVLMAGFVFSFRKELSKLLKGIMNLSA